MIYNNIGYSGWRKNNLKDFFSTALPSIFQQKFRQVTQVLVSDIAAATDNRDNLNIEYAPANTETRASLSDLLARQAAVVLLNDLLLPFEVEQDEFVLSGAELTARQKKVSADLVNLACYGSFSFDLTAAVNMTSDNWDALDTLYEYGGAPYTEHINLGRRRAQKLFDFLWAAVNDLEALNKALAVLPDEQKAAAETNLQTVRENLLQFTDRATVPKLLPGYQKLCYVYDTDKGIAPPVKPSDKTPVYSYEQALSGRNPRVGILGLVLTIINPGNGTVSQSWQDKDAETLAELTEVIAQEEKRLEEEAQEQARLEQERIAQEQRQAAEAREEERLEQERLAQELQRAEEERERERQEQERIAQELKQTEAQEASQEQEEEQKREAAVIGIAPLLINGGDQFSIEPEIDASITNDGGAESSAAETDFPAAARDENIIASDHQADTEPPFEPEQSAEHSITLPDAKQADAVEKPAEITADKIEKGQKKKIPMTFSGGGFVRENEQAAWLQTTFMPFAFQPNIPLVSSIKIGGGLNFALHNKTERLTHSYAQPQPATTAPTAKAGSDQTIILPANSVALDGSASSDSNGSIVSYEWTKVSGPAGETINNPASAQTTVTNLQEGTYVFQLKVIDNDGEEDVDTVTVVVAPQPTTTVTKNITIALGNLNTNGGVISFDLTPTITPDGGWDANFPLGCVTYSITGSTDANAYNDGDHVSITENFYYNGSLIATLTVEAEVQDSFGKRFYNVSYTPPASLVQLTKTIPAPPPPLPSIVPGSGNNQYGFVDYQKNTFKFRILPHIDLAVDSLPLTTPLGVVTLGLENRLEIGVEFVTASADILGSAPAAVIKEIEDLVDRENAVNFAIANKFQLFAVLDLLKIPGHITAGLELKNRSYAEDRYSSSLEYLHDINYHALQSAAVKITGGFTQTGVGFWRNDLLVNLFPAPNAKISRFTTGLNLFGEGSVLGLGLNLIWRPLGFMEYSLYTGFQDIKQANSLYGALTAKIYF